MNFENGISLLEYHQLKRNNVSNVSMAHESTSFISRKKYIKNKSDFHCKDSKCFEQKRKIVGEKFAGSVWTLVLWVEREGMSTFVRAFSLYVAETPKASIEDPEPPLPIIPFHIVAHGFVRQSFSKQL